MKAATEASRRLSFLIYNVAQQSGVVVAWRGIASKEMERTITIGVSLQRAPNAVESARPIGKIRLALNYSAGRRKLVPCLRHESSVASRGDRDMHQHLHIQTW